VVSYFGKLLLVPTPELTRGRKSHYEPRSRRRFPREALSEGTDHGRAVKILRLCPSDRSGGLLDSGAAGPPRAERGKCRRLRGAFWWNRKLGHRPWQSPQDRL